MPSTTTAFTISTAWTLVHSGADASTVAIQFGGGKVVDAHLGEVVPQTNSPAIKLWGDNASPKLFSLGNLPPEANLYLRSQDGLVPVVVMAY